MNIGLKRKKSLWMRVLTIMMTILLMLNSTGVTTLADVIGSASSYTTSSELSGSGAVAFSTGGTRTTLPEGQYGSCTFGFNTVKNGYLLDEYSKYFNYSSPLGVAGSFHIVAFDTATLSAHTNGNILAKELYAGSNFGTSNYPDELTYVQEYVNVHATSASKSNHVLVVGSNNSITKEDNGNAIGINQTKIDSPKNIIQDVDTSNAPFIDLVQVEADINSLSSSLSSVSSTGINNNLSNKQLTLTDPNYAGYVTVKASDINAIGGNGNTLRLDGFRTGCNGTIIINVDCAGVTAVNMPNALVYIDGVVQGTGEVTQFDNGKVIWNFYNADGVTITTHRMLGMVIAPEAYVIVDDNLNGTVVAENVRVQKESHRTDFTGIMTPASATFFATKSVNGRTPNSNQRFSFKLDELVNGTWQNKETKYNSGSNIAFSNIVYSKDSDVGTHWYLIYEDATQNVGGYELSDVQYVIKVVVSTSKDAAGNKKYDKSVSYYKSRVSANELIQNGIVNETLLENLQGGVLGLSFDNKKTENKKTSIALRATKVLTGRTLSAEEFSFVLKDNAGNVIQTKKNAADGSISFDAIEYIKAGQYTYTISEVKENLGGVTYDEKVCNVTVTVTEQNDGSLQAIAAYAGEGATFTNTYAASGSVDFNATKTLTGKTLAKDQFSFVLKDKDGKVLQTVKNDGGGNVDFAKINYTLADAGKTYIYTISEVKENVSGITYDETIYTVKVTITDNGDGSLKVEASDNAKALNFVNKYEATGKVTFAGTKTLEGRALADKDVFTFEIKEGETVVATVKNDATGKIAYPELSYTLKDVGTHTYKVKETSTSGNGIKVDTNTYTVTVEVSDNGDGTLSVVPSDNYQSLDFVNTYRATGSTNFVARKTVNGAAPEEEFTFQVTGPNGYVETVTTVDGVATFAPISYVLNNETDQTGTHTYFITEVNDAKPGYSYTTDTYKVVVTVTDNGNGTLSATPAYYSYEVVDGEEKAASVDDAIFNNTYEASNEIVFNAKKLLTGRSLSAGEFTFILTGTDGTSEEVSNDAAGNVVFTTIEYDLSDKDQTYTYTIKEKNDGKSGHIYSTEEYAVTVEITDDGDGSLELAKTYTNKAGNSVKAEELVFINNYEANGFFTLEADKLVTGDRAKEIEADEFKFVIEENGQVVSHGATVAGSSDLAAIEFEPIDYVITKDTAETEVAAIVTTHTYTVKELQGTDDDITYSPEVYTVTVEVTDDKEGHLTPSITSIVKAPMAEGEEAPEKVTFTNAYTAEGFATIETSKSLNGRPLKDDEFTFQLVEVDGDERTVVETVTAKADGIVKFSELPYTQDEQGPHYYEIVEVKGEDPAITYDETPVSVTVVVADKEVSNGRLDVTVTYSEDHSFFTNTYTAEGLAQISGTKELLGGRGTEIEADEFTFNVINTTTEEVVGTATNDADGNFTVTFGKELDADGIVAPFTQADIDKTYTNYKLVEAAGTDENITYSAQVYNLTVHVEDTAESTGELVVTVTADAASVKFTNNYEAKGEVTVELDKELTGRKQNAGEFTFQMYELIAGETEDAEPSEVFVGSAMNTADGDIVFETIEYTQDDQGTHHYVIREVQGSDKAIDYDEDPVELTVEVEDKEGNGTLSVTPTYEENDTVFTNDYDANGKVTFNGLKKLTGNRGTNVKEGEFTFTVIDDKTGKVAATGATKADGAIEFTEIAYTEAEVGEHTYTVKEDAGEDETITYDSTELKVTVKVTDKGDGTLEAIPSYPEGGLVFTNAYAASGDVQFEAFKALEGNRAGGLKAEEFTFEAVLEGTETVAAAGKSASAGVVVFEKIHYTQDDIGETYTYIISEKAGTDETIVYSNELYKAVVTIKDSEVAGKLDVDVVYTDMSGKALEEKPVFTNNYIAEGKAQISGSKELTGNRAKALEAGEFTFAIINTETNAQVGTAANAADGSFTVTFGKDAVSGTVIPFTQDDIGKLFTNYKLVEVKGSDSTITYDAKEVVLAVRVEDSAASDGTLKVTASAGNVSTAFENHYNAEGTAVLLAEKVLEGNRTKAIQNNEFQFVAECITEDGSQAGKSYNGYYSAEAKQVVFDAIAFDEQDINKTYVYKVSEVKGTDDAIVYSAEVYYAAIAVTDAGNGKLKAEVSYFEDAACTKAVEKAVFTNKFEAEGSAVLGAVKTLEGRELAAGEFIFAVNEIMADGTKVPVKDADGNTLKAVNAADGTITFAPITYTQDDLGEHNYEIVEVKGNATSITYDELPVYAAVIVTDAESNGTLKTEVVYPQGEHTAFVNIYEADGSVTFTGTKNILGNRAAEVKDGEFTFTVIDDATGKEAATGTTKAGGVIEFTTIQYTEADLGTHTYTITENAGEDKAMKYQTEPVKVSVEVKDNGDGTISAEAAYPEGGVVFTNQYTASGSIVMDAVKVLKGAELNADQFTFQLKDADGKVLQTVANDAEGNVTFEAIEYTEADINKEFVYTVSEVNDNVSGITYDETVYTVTVKGEDGSASDGTLAITETVKNGVVEADEMTFTNTFAGEVTLIKVNENNKVLAGAKFQLYVNTAEGWALYTGDNAEGTYVTGEDGIIRVTNLPANDYYFVEIEAPYGYEIFKDEDGNAVKEAFVIGLDDAAGTTEETAEETASVYTEIEVVNEKAEIGSIQVTKKVFIVEGGDIVELKMADGTFYVNLFVDEFGLIPYSDEGPKELKLVDGSTVTVTFENLPLDTYYVFETDAEGNALPMNELLEYEGAGFACVIDEETNVVELDLEADKVEGKFTLNNYFFDFPEGKYMEGEIEISKTVLKGTEETHVEDETFYAGIFTLDENGIYELFEMVELEQNGVVTVKVPLGGENGTEPITYYVFETDESGNRVGDDFKYEVSGEGSVLISENSLTGRVDLINCFEEVEATATPTVTPSVDISTPTPETPEESYYGKDPVKTGDDSPIQMYIMLMLMAMLGLSSVAVVKRRKRK